MQNQRPNATLPPTLPKDLRLIGLTGGSGAGKSIAADRLRQNGIPTLDTDRVSRAVCEAGKPCLSALCDAFGNHILHADGSLDRKGLAAHVFSAPDVNGNETIRAARLQTLNEITHHYILEACFDWAKAQYDDGHPVVCMDAPQLFESGLDRACTFILAITAARNTRIARIMARDGITLEAAQTRLDAQKDDAFFALHCDAVLYNDTSPADLCAKVDRLLVVWGLL